MYPPQKKSSFSLVEICMFPCACVCVYIFCSCFDAKFAILFVSIQWAVCYSIYEVTALGLVCF